MPLKIWTLHGDLGVKERKTHTMWPPTGWGKMGVKGARQAYTARHPTGCRGEVGVRGARQAQTHSAGCED